jgi:hypothetical protein
MPFLLSQAVKLEQDPLKKYVLENLLRQIKVMEVLPFENVESLRVTALRWTHLPSVSFRPLNSDYTEDTSGNVDEVWETLYIMGGTVKFDRVFDKVKNYIKEPKRLQLDMKLKAIALNWNDYFINGDQAVDPEGFEGLKKRVSLMPARQLVLATASGATSLDVTASAANVNLFWGKVERAYAFANGGDVQAILCNEDMKLGLGRSLRYINAAGGNYLDVTKDSFERQVPTYKGTPIYDMGLLADQSTEIITDTETAADAGSDGTSMYFCPFNMEQGITGIQLSPLEIVPDAKKDVATANQTLLEWVNGLAGFGSYGVTRLWNILAPDTWTA